MRCAFLGLVVTPARCLRESGTDGIKDYRDSPVGSFIESLLGLLASYIFRNNFDKIGLGHGVYIRGQGSSKGLSGESQEPPDDLY